MAVLSPVAKQQFFDAGAPAAGYLLYTYAANTTTPLATYSNRAGTVANTNPIVLDSEGRATIYLIPGTVYDYVLKTADGASVWTQPGVVSPESDLVSVKDFGAIGDGITDDTAAIQAAIDHIGTIGGGVVLLPFGTYRLTATLNIAVNGVYLRGASMWRTILTRSTDYGDTIKFTGNDTTGVLLRDAGVSDMRFRSTALTTSGAHLNMNGVWRCDMNNISMENGFIGFKFAALTAATLDNVYLVFNSLFGGSATGRRYMLIDDAPATYAHPHCGDVFISNFNLRGGGASATVTEYGIRIKSSDGVWFSNGHVGDTTVANINLDHGTQNNNLCFFDNVMSDGCDGDGVLFTGSGTSTARDHKFTNCEISGGALGLRGIRFAEGTDFESVAFVGCTVRWFTQSGVIMESVDTRNISYTGCNVRGNSHGNSNVYSNYFFVDGVVGVSISGGNAGGPVDTGGTIYTKYGLDFSGAVATTQIIATGVNLTGNLTGPTRDTGTSQNTVINGCIDTGDVFSAASAAVVDIPRLAELVTITGTTAINSLQLQGRGRRVTLLFDGALTVNDSVGNLRLASNFVTTAGDTLTLICDGTLWHEIARSVN